MLGNDNLLCFLYIIDKKLVDWSKCDGIMASFSSNTALMLPSEDLFDINKCVVCQKAGGSLISTDNGRRKVMVATELRKGCVLEQLKSIAVDGEFKYHLDCYKNYTHKKALEKAKVSLLLFYCFNVDPFCDIYIFYVCGQDWQVP